MANVLIIPAILSQGFIRHAKYSATTTARRVFDPASLTSTPNDTAKAIVIRAFDTNAINIFVADSAVLTTDGFPLAATDVIAAPIDGKGATSFYQIAATAVPAFQIFELG